MMDVNDFHWWPSAPHLFVGRGCWGFQFRSPEQLCRCRVWGRRPFAPFQNSQSELSSSLPSWSDRRPSKFMRRRLKVIKRWKADSFSFWPGSLSSLAGSHLLSSFCLQSSLHCGILVTTSNGQSVGTSVQRVTIGFAYETNFTLDIKWPNSTEIVCSRRVNKNVKEITQKWKFCPFV